MSEKENVEIGMKAFIPLPSSNGKWRYMFLKRKTGQLDIPGGRLEDVDFKDTDDPYLATLDSTQRGLQREVREETGLQVIFDGENKPLPIDLFKIDLQPKRLNVVRIVLLAKVAMGPHQLSDEHEASNVLWLTRAEALKHNPDDSLKELLEKEGLFAFERLGEPSEMTIRQMHRAMVYPSSQAA